MIDRKPGIAAADRAAFEIGAILPGLHAQHVEKVGARRDVEAIEPAVQRPAEARRQAFLLAEIGNVQGAARIECGNGRIDRLCQSGIIDRNRR